MSWNYCHMDLLAATLIMVGWQNRAYSCTIPMTHIKFSFESDLHWNRSPESWLKVKYVFKVDEMKINFDAIRTVLWNRITQGFLSRSVWKKSSYLKNFTPTFCRWRRWQLWYATTFQFSKHIGATQQENTKTTKHNLSLCPQLWIISCCLLFFFLAVHRQINGLNLVTHSLSQSHWLTEWVSHFWFWH